ncbi:MAG TPA: zinc ribbon domain-containing protein, partial [Pyrinomonadaceae bacterium]
MFCPQCGQQQTSDAARFCSRCGFQLAAVSGLLATNGAAPEAAFEAVAAPASPRRKGARLGGKLMMTGLFLAPALGALSEVVGFDDGVALLGVIVFLAGLFRLLYALIFEDGPYRRQLQRQPSHFPSAQFAPAREAATLPPAQGAPARSYVPPR